MKKNTTALLLTLLFVVGMVLSACGSGEGVQPPAKEKQEVKLYYASKAYEETGDETLPKLLEETRTIEVEADGNVGIAMLEALKKPEGSDAGTAVKEDIVFLDVRSSEEDDITVIVDISGEGLSGGSLEETLFIDQVVKTILNNPAYFTSETKTPEQVQFLVDGQITESLMGHIDASQPFTKDY